MIAALLVTVVMEGIADREVEVAVYQELFAATSNGVELSTPENATMAPVAAEELAVTEKV
jgi:hypothetical protein